MQSFQFCLKKNLFFSYKFYLALYFYVYIMVCCYSTAQSYEVTVLNTANKTSEIEGWLEKRYVDGIEESNSTYGWAQVSLPVIGWRIFQICPPPHNNNFQLKKVQSWLRSPLVKIKDVSRLYIDLEFWMRECFDLDDTICRETFKISYKFANESDSDLGNLLHDDYITIDTVAAEERFLPNDDHDGFEVNRETVSVQIPLDGQESNDGIYVSVVDEGACVSLKSIRVYYKMCPKKITNLAEFPKTHTGQFDTSLVEVTGKCVQNSMPALNDDLNGSSSPLYHCTSSGIWQVTKGTCQCKKGYEPDSLRFKCRPCALNFYKTSRGNSLCDHCPANSFTKKKGSSYCLCSSDHIQFNSTGMDECNTCSKLPSNPVGMKIVPSSKKNSGVVELKWSPPYLTGGCHKLFYCVFSLSCKAAYVDFPTTSLLSNHTKYNFTTQPEFYPYDRNNKSLSNRNCQIVQNFVIFPYLKAESCYQFVVLSVTEVTRQQYAREYDYLSKKQTHFSTGLAQETMQVSKILKVSGSTIQYHTNITTPSEVTGLTVLSQNESTCYIKWKKPLYTGKNIITYQVKWASIDNTGRSTGDLSRILVNSTSAVLSGLKPGVTYRIAVRAKNTIGNGQYSEMVKVKTSKNPVKPTEINSSYLYLVAAISLILILLIIFIIAWFKCNPHKRDNNGNGNLVHYKDATHFSSLTDISEQRTYVDPFLLGAVNHHNFICEMSPSLISVLNVIGCGEFGEVYRGKLTQQDCEEGPEIIVDVAVKILHAQCLPHEQMDFLREAMALERFKHPNIVKLEAVVTSTRPFMICTELMNHGCLGAFLQKHRERGLLFDANVLVGMMLGVANGMAYLSRLNYVHRDLAARNVLINTSLVCKVADFGLTRNLSTNNKKKGMCPSYTTQGGKIAIRWTSPESIAYQCYSQASDVWSFGVFAWEVVTYGEKPYWNLTNQQVLQAVNEGFRLPAPEDCPSVVHQLMLQCWLRDRQLRPTFVQVVSKLNQMLHNSESLEILASPASTGAGHEFFTDSPPHTPLPVPMVTDGQSHHNYATCSIVHDQSPTTNITDCTTLLADSLIKETSLSDSMDGIPSTLIKDSEPFSSTNNNNVSRSNGLVTKL